MQHRIFTVVSICIMVFVLVTFVLRIIVFPVFQKSVSMEPDIVPGSCILVSPLIKTPVRGEIVLLKPVNEEKKNALFYLFDDIVAFFTGQQLFPFSSVQKMSSSFQLRRVIGVPGDTLYMTDYVVYLKPAGETHYLTEFEYAPSAYPVMITASPAGWDKALGPKASFSTITLGENEYFVLGDNRNNCVDSRIWGPVKASRIKGKALLLYFPFSKFKVF